MQIEKILIEMSKITDRCSQLDWARSFRSLADDLEECPEETMATLRAMYGGAGSLSDLVLYIEGVPDDEINDRFDE